MSTEIPSQRLVLLDGHAIIHRAYHAVQEPLVVRRTGEVVTAVYGFANTLLKVLEELKPSHVAVCLDHPSPTFRHNRDVTYKAHRPEAPDDLRAQIRRIRELIDAFNMPIYEAEGYEADDVMGALAKQASERGIETYLVTLDSDIAQLVRPGVYLYMYRLYQRDTVIYDEERVRERYGVLPHQMPDLKGLKGDASDNIPGVPGVGEKIAVRLIQQFGSVEGIYERIDEVQPARLRDLLIQHREQALHSKQMATIVTDVPVTLDMDACRLNHYDRQKVLDLFRELEFRSLVDRLPPADLVEERKQQVAVSSVREEVSYQTVTDRRQLDDLAARLRQAGTFTFDTETTDLNAMRALLVGISVSPQPGEAYYIPVGHATMFSQDTQLPLEDVLAVLKPIFEDERLGKVAHNGKYDMVVLAQNGVWTNNLTFDTMIAAFILGEGGGGRPGEGALGLKWLASKHLGVEMTPITDLIGRGPKQVSMAQVDIEQASRYACADADMTGRLKEILANSLHQQGLWHLFSEIEMPLVPVLARMELTGMALDPEILRDMSRTLNADLKRLEQEIYEIVGHRFNIGSTQQLSNVLFEELKLPKTRRTQSGYSTDARSLEGLRGVHPIIDKLFEYRQIAKLISTYVDALPAMVNAKTGRLHTTFSQIGAATGRLSSNDPNLMNIPVRGELGGQVRRAFIARDVEPDPHLLAADYSQIELRILAHICQDPALVDAFLKDEDIHAATAAQVFGVEMQQVTSEMRRRAKVFNFGVLYGLSAYGLSVREGISREEAAQFIDTYFAKYPGIRAYIDDTIKRTRELGYAETLLGRRRYLPEIKSPNAQVRQAAERMAINMPIQGTAADIIKIAMSRIQAEIERRQLKSRMILQVHDELIFECPRPELDEMKALALDIMPRSLTMRVPLKVDVEVGKNWADMEKW